MKKEVDCVMHSLFYERITEARHKKIMHIVFVKENINILLEHSGGSYNNSLLFMVLKNDYKHIPYQPQTF